MTSPLTTVPVKVAVVVEVALCLIVSAGVVRSLLQHDHPCVAVAPANVIRGEHAVCPATNEPALGPPVRLVVVPHPDVTVKVVPDDMKRDPETPPELELNAPPAETVPARAKFAFVFRVTESSW
jgi:hypothetical protein